jgi:hypothetical protein
MSPALQFDEATSRRIEATYSTPDVVEQRRIVRAALGLKPGQDVLDIGSGPTTSSASTGTCSSLSNSVPGAQPRCRRVVQARRRTMIRATTGTRAMRPG